MEKLETRMIMEIMGRPAQHLVDTMKALTDKLGQEKGVNIKNIKIHDPIEIKEAKNLYTTFAEIDIDFDSVGNYLGIIFAYLPSNIEIISPQKITLSSESLNLLGNNLISRMHSYDAIAKKMLAEKENLERQINSINTDKPVIQTKPAKKKDKKKKKSNE
jgi:hypothetical protein